MKCLWQQSTPMKGMYLYWRLVDGWQNVRRGSTSTLEYLMRFFWQRSKMEVDRVRSTLPTNTFGFQSEVKHQSNFEAAKAKAIQISCHSIVSPSFPTEPILIHQFVAPSDIYIQWSCEPCLSCCETTGETRIRIQSPLNDQPLARTGESFQRHGIHPCFATRTNIIQTIHTPALTMGIKSKSSGLSRSSGRRLLLPNMPPSLHSNKMLESLPCPKVRSTVIEAFTLSFNDKTMLTKVAFSPRRSPSLGNTATRFATQASQC